MKRILYFNITYRCNSNCIFCAADTGADNGEEELSPEEFERVLAHQHIEVQDQVRSRVDGAQYTSEEPGQSRIGCCVILNGGEPTVHRDFFKILQIARDYDTYIDLYTNGVKLHDRDFTTRLVGYAPMLIRIPFFGATAATHDRLTGYAGNLGRTIQGFANVIEMQKEYDVQLEAKLLLSKATCSENRKIAELLTRTFPRTFCFSINPLLVSERVKRHAATLLERYSRLIEQTDDVVKFILDKGWRLSLSLLPYCVLPTEYHPLVFPHVDKVMKMHLYVDPYTSKEKEKQLCSEKCRSCSLREVCPGFPKNYVKFYGDDEVTPM